MDAVPMGGRVDMARLGDAVGAIHAAPPPPADVAGGPAPAASCLHGDLWGGNYGATPEGVPVLFDPATYYGHAE
eukprot:contig_47051_g10274